jgi:hydrogenase expression/formation protein HypE
MAPAENHRIVGTKGSQTRDHVIITGGAGIEGTAILASDFTDEGKLLGLTDEEISEGAKLGKEISILKEAIILARHNATSMHDVTRGGIRETSLEIAKLSGKALEIDIDQIPARSIVARFSQAFSFDPLGMISSGSLVATLPEKDVPEVLKELQMQGIPATDAGIVKNGKGVKFIQQGREISFENIHCEEDELARMWALYK